jgi:hypothetical protein
MGGVRLDQALPLFQRLFDGASGYELSRRGRDAVVREDLSLIYGEAIPQSFYELMCEAQPRAGERFVDLGSGLGKPVVLAALLFDFARCSGFEVVPALAEESRRICARLRDEAESANAGEVAPVEVLQGDFRAADLSDVGVLFTHASCFEMRLLNDLDDKVSELPLGARVVVVGRMLRSRKLVRRYAGHCEMDWGKAMATVYERR